MLWYMISMEECMMSVLQGLSETATTATEAPAAASSDLGPVRYPTFAGSAPVDEYAAYPDVSPVSVSPRVSQRTELFMDYYSDVSR